MSILKLLFYLAAPWTPLMWKNWLYQFKIAHVLFVSILFSCPFLVPLSLGYSYKFEFLFFTSTILFLIALGILLWLLGSARRYLLVMIVLNVFTVFIYWSFSSQNSRVIPIQVLIESNEEYVGVEEYTLEFGNYTSYSICKKMWGGIFIEKLPLRLIPDSSGRCMHKTFDEECEKIIIWDKCSNTVKIY